MAALAGVAALKVTGAAAAGAATVGCLLVKELSSQAFSLTVAHLTEVLAYLGRRPDHQTRAVHDQVALLVPTAKLRIIQCMLSDFEWLRDESRTIDSLCERLAELADSIRIQVRLIGLAVEEFNKLWFRSWRTLDVSAHTAAIRSDVQDLQDTFELLKVMLPLALRNPKSYRNTHAKNNSNNAEEKLIKPPITNVPALEAPSSTTSSAARKQAELPTTSGCTSLVLANSWTTVEPNIDCPGK
jgi:hypothetical protein